MTIRDNLISGPLGFGSAPLGNMFRNIPEAEAAATVDAAWQQGIRYFDTAPLYGAGQFPALDDQVLVADQPAALFPLPSPSVSVGHCIRPASGRARPNAWDSASGNI